METQHDDPADGNVGVVVDDLEAATAFFVELGLEPEGEAAVQGRWTDRVAGLDGVRVKVSGHVYDVKTGLVTTVIDAKSRK